MNAVGIDVSKGKSMVCVMRPFGEVVLEPFEVLHTAQNLRILAGKLKALDGETRIVLFVLMKYLFYAAAFACGFITFSVSETA